MPKCSLLCLGAVSNMGSALCVPNMLILSNLKSPRWAASLRIPILCVDYTLAPGAMFPVSRVRFGIRFSASVVSVSVRVMVKLTVRVRIGLGSDLGLVFGSETNQIQTVVLTQNSV